MVVPHLRVCKSTTFLNSRDDDYVVINVKIINFYSLTFNSSDSLIMRDIVNPYVFIISALSAGLNLES